MKNTKKATAPQSQKTVSTTRAPRPNYLKAATVAHDAIARDRESSGRTKAAMRIAILAAIARVIATGKPVLVEWFTETMNDAGKVVRVRHSFNDGETYRAGSYNGAHRPVMSLATDDQKKLVRPVAVVNGPRGRQFTTSRNRIGDVYIVPSAMKTRSTDTVPAGM